MRNIFIYTYERKHVYVDIIVWKIFLYIESLVA